MGRAPCCDKNGLKKGPWTPEEDAKLISYIQTHGAGNWRTLPKNAGMWLIMASYSNISVILIVLIRAVMPRVYNCVHDLFIRATKMWKELSSSLDKLFEARYQERKIFF